MVDKSYVIRIRTERWKGNEKTNYNGPDYLIGCLRS